MTTENTAYTSGGLLVPLLARVHHIHFIGICGASMRGLALACAAGGYTVTGSDGAVGDATPDLAAAGIGVHLPDPHGPITLAELAVYSLAIPADHAELAVARHRGIPTVSRADLLAALLHPYRHRIGVAGTHGKSTVSAMCAHLLAGAGRSPTAFVGAGLASSPSGYLSGQGDVAVFEACEYRRSFLCFAPTLAVLTNAEWDHPDCYPEPESIREAFYEYLTLPSVRQAVISADDAVAMSLAARLSLQTVTFGLSPTAHIRAAAVAAEGEGMSFDLFVAGVPLGKCRIGVRGEHNVKNALAAYAVAYALGIPLATSALADFFGARRRLEARGRYAGVAYYEDYAHHPTEIRAAIASLRGGEGRLIAVFQPHTYTRTAALFEELAAALSTADCVIVTDVYAAREAPISGVNARALAAACSTPALYLATPEAAALSVRTRAVCGDTVLLMGAGDLAARFFRGPLAF